jgi:O-antigen biosynthesis protein
MNIHAIAKGFRFLLQYGLRETIHRIRFGERIDIMRKYDYVRVRDAIGGDIANTALPNTINWFISGFAATSGGHINIMRFVQKLESFGYECRIVIINGAWMKDAESARQEICRAFGTVNAQVYLDVNSAPAAFASIATGYNTAYYVHAFVPCQMKFYFVQDFEPWFYARGSHHDFAENSYKFNFVGLTAGNWLAEKLNSEYGMATHPFSFSYDQSLYQSRARPAKAMKRVLFYARPETERRAFETGILALDELCRRRSDVEVVLAGGDLSRYKIPFPHKIAGRVMVSELGGLYNSCDAGLVLSSTNASLLPLELMACGTPVVSNIGPWVEWLLSAQVVKLAPLDFVDLANALEAVLFDAVEWNRLHRAGLEFASLSSWDKEATKVAAALSQYGCRPIQA